MYHATEQDSVIDIEPSNKELIPHFEKIHYDQIPVKAYIIKITTVTFSPLN